MPDRADPWTRMSYAGPNQPVAPIDDPYQMFEKLYGQMKDKETLKSVLDDLQDDFKNGRAQASAPRTGGCSRSTSRSCARWSRTCSRRRRRRSTHPMPPARAGHRRTTTTTSRKLSRMQIDLLVNALANDMARVATLQYTNSVGNARMRWLGDRRGPPRRSRTSRTSTKGRWRS